MSWRQRCLVGRVGMRSVFLAVYRKMLCGMDRSCMKNPCMGCPYIDDSSIMQGIMGFSWIDPVMSGGLSYTSYRIWYGKVCVFGLYWFGMVQFTYCFFGKRSYTAKSVKIWEKVAFCPTFPHFLPETVSFSAWMFFVWLMRSIAGSYGLFFGRIDRLSGGRVECFVCRGFPVACGAFLWLLVSCC